MKQTTTRILTLLTICAVCCAALLSCTFGDPVKKPWDDATYTQDTALGEGEITFYFTVNVEEHHVTFTVSTNETNLRRALQALSLIAGDESEYGLYVKTVNGITADYDTDGAWWALYEGDEMSMVGVDGVTVSPDGRYSFTYTKG